MSFLEGTLARSDPELAPTSALWLVPNVQKWRSLLVQVGKTNSRFPHLADLPRGRSTGKS